MAKDLAAAAGEEIDPEAAMRIQEDTYVDDGVTGGTPEQVARFIGIKTEDGTFDGTSPRILAKANFKSRLALQKYPPQYCHRLHHLHSVDLLRYHYCHHCH